MISVIVPTYNRTECLYTMLRSLNVQTEKSFEVIVVDQSENITPEKIQMILSACRNVHYYHINRKGRPVAKNFGIDIATGTILLFCDDDIVVENNFLAVHKKLHDDLPKVGALSCHLIESHQKEIICKTPLKITVYGRFLNRPNAIYEGNVTSLNGGNMSFKKEALDLVGYFEEALAGTSMLEEPDIAFRLQQQGYSLYFSSLTKVKHYPQHNGNINTLRKEHYQWVRDYFFNQFYFMIRNRRKKFFPFIYMYLSYRSLMETIKGRNYSFQYLMLPTITSLKAFQCWQRQNNRYKRSHWFTPSICKPLIIQYHKN
jgi:GT2 family glycosyltransferase